MITLLSIALAALTGAAPTQPAAKTVHLLFSSSRMAEVSPCKCEAEPLGGVGRYAAAIERLRSQYGSLVLIDGGDNFFASPEQATSAQAQPRAELIADTFRATKPDVMVPGERDFLRGAPALRDLGIRAIAPWVLANVSPPPGRANMFVPAYVVKTPQAKVLVLGALGLKAFPDALKQEGWTYEEPTAALRRWIAMYRAAADVIVVVLHGDPSYEQKIAEQLPEVSLLFNGHEGRLQFGARAVGKLQTIAAGALGKHLVHLELRLNHVRPALQAGSDAQRYLQQRQAASQPALDALDANPLAKRDLLLFQLVPLGVDAGEDATLRDRAEALDPRAPPR